MGPQVITTVVTPASTYDLTTLAIVKDELSITVTTYDTILQRYLTSASAAAAQYCNRVFPSETVKDEFFSQRDQSPRLIIGGLDVLQLTRWPIISVTSIVENGVTLTVDTDYKIDFDNGQILRIGDNGYQRRWPTYSIVVTYVAGFATIPPDVADATIRLVSTRYLARGRDKNVRQESIPGVREVQYWVPTGNEAGNMPPDVADLLDNYRVPVMAA